MDKNSVLIFFGLVILAGSIFVRADNGRYSFAYSESLTYAKLDTHTGDAWLCGAAMDTCIPMTNKASFLAYAAVSRAVADGAKTIEQLKSAGFSDDEIKRWVNEQKPQP